jgi:hypothetical protein
MSMERITIPVSAIREGDRFAHDGHVHWIATGDAVVDADGACHVPVVYMPDRGHGSRVWDDAAMALEVERDG